MNRKIGRFEITSELGRGAQSVVYLGMDTQLQREVAIKTMHFAQPNPEQNRVLLSEARTVGKLRHPNIVPIYEAGEEGGDIYLVFEYIRGKNLADFLRDGGALPPAKAAAVLRKVLDALAAAHAQGIIHHDLKPSNILLDENSLPRVMDFGVAVREGEPGEDNDELVGSPSYMAPEYIAKRVVDERTDVFAAGLILYEMLVGRRAVEGPGMFQILHRIANEDIRLPDGVAVDDVLASMLYKAIARDPEMRYQSAAQFAEALERYLEPASGERSPVPAGKQATIDFLLRRMRHKSDFPGLSESVTTINRIASSEQESVNKLSNTILKDFALTNKILKLVNSAYFRPAGGGSISTVSCAVIVLGFEAVRNVAISLLLFEHMQNKENVAQLKDEFLRASLAGIVARGVGAHLHMRDLEQVYICALFQNLGRLLAQYYFPEESNQVRAKLEQKPCTEEQAALQVLGISFEDLGAAIALQWGFPPLIVSSMRALPKGRVHKPTTAEGRLQTVAGFANELCAAIVGGGGAEARDKEIRKLLGRYGESVALGEKELQETLVRAIEEIIDFAGVIQLNLKQSPFGRQIRQFAYGHHAPDEEGADPFGSITLLPGSPLDGIGDGSGKSSGADVQAVLSAGIQDISNALVDGFKLNDILHIILETMYRAMGFRRVVLCIKDARTNSMQGRFGFGPEAQEVVKKFRFPIHAAKDVFCAATTKGTDLLISNVDDPKIAACIPEWYRKALPAKSFVLFPLNIKGNPVALIYADKDKPNEIEIPEKYLTLLRTLRNQAVLAIKHGN